MLDPKMTFLQLTNLHNSTLILLKYANQSHKTRLLACLLNIKEENTIALTSAGHRSIHLRLYNRWGHCFCSILPPQQFVDFNIYPAEILALINK